MYKKSENNNKQKSNSPKPIKKNWKINKPNKSKYIINTPMSRKINITNPSFVNTSTKTLNDEEAKKNQQLSTKVRIQNNIINEYQKWIGILLTVINDKKTKENLYTDTGSPIQRGLENIQNLLKTNMDIKLMIIEKKLNNENLQKQLEQKKKNQNLIIKEYNEKDKIKILNIKQEKEQLEHNVQMLGNELDELSENNKQINDKIQNNNKLKMINDLICSKNQLKKENMLLKQILVIKHRNNFLEHNIGYKTMDNMNTINNLEQDICSIGPISKMGDYQIEKEEHNNNFSSLCGL